MNLWYIIGVILGIFFILLLIFSLPRKKNKRKPSIEAIDDLGVAKAFEKMTKFLPFKILRKRIISELMKHNLHGVLVDVGCGSGNLIVQIAHKFKDLDLIGIDNSKYILNLAEQRADKNGFNKRIDFQFGSVENLPFADNSIDVIVSSLSLHHWLEPVKAFKELIRVLREDGTILIFDFRRNSRKFFYGLLTFATKLVVPKALKRINEPLGSLKAGYTAEEIRVLLIQANIYNFDIKPYLAWMFISIRKSKVANL